MCTGRTASNPRLAVEDNTRMSLLIAPEEKTIRLRAAALKRTDLMDFVRQHSLKAAREVIEEAERLELSERDNLRVLELLENPPKPNPKLLDARSPCISGSEHRRLARAADKQTS